MSRRGGHGVSKVGRAAHPTEALRRAAATTPENAGGRQVLSRPSSALSWQIYPAKAGLVPLLRRFLQINKFTYRRVYCAPEQVSEVWQCPVKEPAGCSRLTGK